MCSIFKVLSRFAHHYEKSPKAPMSDNVCGDMNFKRRSSNFRGIKGLLESVKFINFVEKRWEKRILLGLATP